METTKRGAAERRCVVIGGADIGRYDRIRARLREDALQSEHPDPPCLRMGKPL